MDVLVNGEMLNLPEQLTIQGLLAFLELTNNKVAVAVNQHIIPASEYHTIIIKNKDVVEVVRAVGGG